MNSNTEYQTTTLETSTNNPRPAKEIPFKENIPSENQTAPFVSLNTLLTHTMDSMPLLNVKDTLSILKYIIKLQFLLYLMDTVVDTAVDMLVPIALSEELEVDIINRCHI